MKVILLENVKKIGSIGEIINVKRGFGRNFLIANKKALYASKDNILQVEKIKTDSSMLVFPEPFLPKKKFIPGDSCKSTFLKHLKLLIEIFVKDTFR